MKALAQASYVGVIETSCRGDTGPYYLEVKLLGHRGGAVGASSTENGGVAALTHKRGEQGNERPGPLHWVLRPANHRP